MYIYDKNNEIIASFNDGILTDTNGRTHLSLNSSGNAILERYVNTPDKLKQQIALLYNKLTSQSIPDTMKFLNFEDELFCS
jgi:hypothetical protein